MKCSAMGLTAALTLAGFVFGGEVKEVSGTVKSVSDTSFVVTDIAGRDWTFAVDGQQTEIVAKGTRQKLGALTSDAKTAGAKAGLNKVVLESSSVKVMFSEGARGLLAKEIHTGGGGDPCYPPTCKCKDGTCSKKCCRTK